MHEYTKELQCQRLKQTLLAIEAKPLDLYDIVHSAHLAFILMVLSKSPHEITEVFRKHPTQSLCDFAETLLQNIEELLDAS